MAIEPSAALRSVLLLRVHRDEGLRARVTVLPEDFLRAPLPERNSMDPNWSGYRLIPWHLQDQRAWRSPSIEDRRVVNDQRLNPAS